MLAETARARPHRYTQPCAPIRTRKPRSVPVRAANGAKIR